MSLDSIIKQYLKDKMTAEEIVADLSLEVPVIDNKPYSYKKMIEVYGEGFVNDLLNTLRLESEKKPILGAVYVAILTEGLNFASPENKVIIQTLLDENVISQDYVDKLSSLNETMKTKAEIFGIDVYDLKTVQDAVDKYNTDIQRESERVDNINWWQMLHNSIFPQLESGAITKEQAIAMVK